MYLTISFCPHLSSPSPPLLHLKSPPTHRRECPSDGLFAFCEPSLPTPPVHSRTCMYEALLHLNFKPVYPVVDGIPGLDGNTITIISLLLRDCLTKKVVML